MKVLTCVERAEFEVGTIVSQLLLNPGILTHVITFNLVLFELFLDVIVSRTIDGDKLGFSFSYLG